MEAASGRDLSSFLEQWLRRSGLPRLEGSWRHDAARAEIEVVIEQVQDGEPYRLSLELEVRGDAGEPPERHRLDLPGREGRLRVPRARAPREVVLDPDAGLLAEMTPLRRTR
jgi:aminopeptidase N